MLNILIRAGSFIGIIVMGYLLKRIGFFKDNDFSILSKTMTVKYWRMSSYMKMAHTELILMTLMKNYPSLR